MAQAKRRYKPGEIFQNPLVALAAVALAALIIILVTRSSCSGVPNSNYYCQGVYINGVEMSRYTKAQGEKWLTDREDALLGKTYTYTFEDRKWTFSPKDINASYNTGEVLSKAWNLGHTGSSSDRASLQQELRLHNQYFTTELSYDEAKLDEFINSIAREVYIEPVDADIVLTATEPRIVAQSQDGRELDSEGMKAQIVSLMKQGSTENTFALPVEVKIPAVSSSAAENGLQLIVTYSTDLSASSSNRCHNVALALSRFNAFEVKPGETVSFNEVVGARTILNGYYEATVYYGESVSTGVGGGVCQASSTLYGALMKAGMTTLTRDHHALVVDYCQASMDAAVSDTQDFVFTNDTDYAIYIYTSVVNKDKATVRIYSNRPEYRIELESTIIQNNIKNSAITERKDTNGEYAYYTTEKVLVKEGKLGRKSKLERIYYDWDTGREVSRETLSEDYYSGERDIYYVGVHTP